MEKEKNIGEVLGLQQQDMAIFLLLPLSNWAMYATGQRGLPKEAHEKLAEMLAFLKEQDEDGDDTFTAAKGPGSRAMKFCEDELIRNQKKQNTMATQLEKCKAKYTSARNGLKLAGFLTGKMQEKWQEEQLLIIKKRTETAIEKNNLELQAEYECKLRLLKEQEVSLKRELSGN
ncbi:hypothetical protein GJU43_13650 [Flavobacterium sp. LC2016-23]|uniref:hypothetical protein n=1 Tax=Flavobacterium sp. LC2016-23 TaxID=2666330 RepID=UPI0012B038D6|nr:hypothetical protein [Flavobacterium sp. LC2016-23]MRX40327.1 hypothetical protein [Flavobacterium sp. LC2016-23]